MEDLSKYSNLFNRNGRYYFRVRVPKDLVHSLNKTEIKQSLNTSDRKEAIARVNIKRLEADRLFENTRKKQYEHLVASQSSQARSDTSLAVDLSKIEIEREIALWHSEALKTLNSRDDSFRLNAKPHELSEALETCIEDLAVLEAGDESQFAGGMQRVVKKILPDLSSKNNSDLYQYAVDLVRQASIEQAHESYNRLSNSTSNRVPYSLFPTRNLDSQTILENQTLQPAYLSTVIDQFKHSLKQDGVSQKTLNGYKLPFNLLIEYLGKNFNLRTITSQHCRDYREVLMKVPSNAKKHYKTLSLLEAVEAHSSRSDGFLSTTSVNGNMTKISSLLNYAVKEGLIDKNPISTIRKIKEKKSIEDGRISYNSEQLTKIFNAPIYTGCMDDQHNYAKAGNNIPRRHRFWIPLIALHTGMRQNEICQLFTSDIKQENGIYYIHIVEDGEIKHLKTRQSERKVPIHQNLIGVGFLDYVNSIKSKESKMLFPDIEPSAQNSYSDNFSKWFARFLKSIGIKAHNVNFHCFRHTFKDLMSNSEVVRDAQMQIGGWKRSDSVMDDYGRGYTLEYLNDCIQKTQIPVDLSHLAIPCKSAVKGKKTK